MAKKIVGQGYRFKSNREVERALRKSHVEGQGVWSLHVIPRDAYSRLVASTREGRQVIELVREALETVHRVDPPIWCLFCPGEIRCAGDVAAVTIVLPYIDQPSQGLVQLVCEGCAAPYAGRFTAFNARVLDRVRELFIADARVIRLAPMAGRA